MNPIQNPKSNSHALYPPAPTGPFYYDIYLGGANLFQAALYEVELYDTNGEKLTTLIENVSNVYAEEPSPFQSGNPTDIVMLFDGSRGDSMVDLPILSPIEYYHNGRVIPADGFQLFTIETQVPVSQVKVYWNYNGSPPGANWYINTVDSITQQVHSITEYGTHQFGGYITINI